MATNVATLISRINSELTQPSPREMSTDLFNRRNELWVKLLTRLEQFQAKEKHVLANRTLSDEGKRQQQAKLAEELLSDLAWFGRVLSALEKEQAQRETVLFAIDSPVKDELLRYHRSRELRDRMAGLNQAQRDQAYLVASQRDQSEVLLALLNAPGGSWVTPDIQHRADVERAKQAKPDLFETYTQNSILREHLHSMAEHLALWLRSYGTSPETVSTGLGLAA